MCYCAAFWFFISIFSCLKLGRWSTFCGCTTSSRFTFNNFVQKDALNNRVCRNQNYSSNAVQMLQNRSRWSKNENRKPSNIPTTTNEYQRNKKRIELNTRTIYNFFTVEQKKRGHKHLEVFLFSHNYHLLNNNNLLILIYYSLFNVQNIGEIFIPIAFVNSSFVQNGWNGVCAKIISMRLSVTQKRHQN